MSFKVSIIQSDLVWENIYQNLINFSKKFDSLEDDVDLVVLPEMFTTGFTNNSSDVAELMNGKTVNWMLQSAQKLNVAIAGSIIINENNHFYNRLIWAFPNGTYSFYDKRHLFRMGDEQDHFSAGTTRTIIEYKGFRFLPLICYDLRFPVWSRNCNDYDALLYVANWPQTRASVWKQLLPARAIENQCYAIAANRVGVDGMNLTYSGDSMVVDFKGNTIAQANSNAEQILSINLDLEALQNFKEKFPAYLDADKFNISL